MSDPRLLMSRAGDPGYDTLLARLCARDVAALRPGAADDAPHSQARIDADARSIVADVERLGDPALVAHTRRFDGWDATPQTLEVPRDAWAAAAQEVSPEALAALGLMQERVARFHERQRERGFEAAETLDGGGRVVLSQRVFPLRRVGVYVPGGRAAYPSTVLMNVIPARVAGVEEIVVVTPARGGSVPPAVLAAAHLAGASRLFAIGGAQAVGALAYGTERVPRVEKIVGPGNAWVAAAKRLVAGSGAVLVDTDAGPSELGVVADGTAEPAWVAADVLSQAEHDPRAVCVVFTPDLALAAAVEARLLSSEWPSAPGVVAILVTRSLEEALAASEAFAAEHLELMCEGAAEHARSLRAAGTIFVGPHAPTPLGDYVAGVNHVLPTGGAARSGSPLGVHDFVKRTNVVECDAAALRVLGPPVQALARAEGLPFHAAAIRARLE